MGILDTAKNIFGNLPLPDFGISENLGGQTGSLEKPYVDAANAVQIKSNVLGSQDTGQTFGPVNQPQGGGGAGVQGLIGDLTIPPAPGVNSESFKKEESFINEGFAAAISGIDNLIASLQGALGGNIAAEQEQGALLTSQTQQEGESGQAALGQQKTEARQAKDSSVAQSRRVGFEGLQGVQSRFGGSTGTGGFVGELLQRQVSRNIGEANTAFQNTIAKIDQASTDLRNNVNNMVQQLELNTREAVRQLNAELQQNIATLGATRGGIEADKANAKIDLVSRYREDQANIQAQNQQLKNQLLVKAAEAQGMFDKLKQDKTLNFGETQKLLTSQGFTPTDVDESFTAGKIQGPNDPNRPFRVTTDEDEGEFGLDSIAKQFGIEL